MRSFSFIIFLVLLPCIAFSQEETQQQEAIQQAADYYLSKIRSKPNDLDLHRELMEAFKENGLTFIPVSIYSNSVERNPSNHIVLYLLGYAYLMADQEPVEEGSPEPLQMAEKNLKAALEAKPQFPDALAALGDYYLKTGKTDLAVAKWEEAVKMDERAEPAHRSLARFYRSQKQYDKAIEEYQKTIYLKPLGIAKRYLELGSTYLDMGDLDKAEADLTKAKNYDSKLAMAYYKLGQVYAKRGQQDKATDLYRTGRKYDPKNAEVAYELALIFLDTNDIKYALLSMERGLSTDAVDPRISEELISYIEKDTAAAVDYMSQLADFEYSDNFYLHYFLGKLYLKQGNDELALKHFKSAAELSPTNTDVYYQMGLLQEKLEPEKAKEQYRRAVELGASDADLLFKTAQSYLDEGNEGKFIEMAKKALDINPNRADVHLQLAMIFQKRADIYKNAGKKEESDKALEEAVKHFEQVAELQPDPQKWYDLGLLYERQEKIKAVRAYDKAIQLKPDFALAYYRRGDFRLNYKVGRASVLMYKPEVAVDDLKKAIELDPKLADAHLSLGMAYHQMDMPEQATAEFEKTVEIDPNNVKAHIYLAQDYTLVGDNEKVIEHLSKAAELDDSNAEVLKELGAMQLRFGGDAGLKPAQNALEKAFKLKPDDPEILNNYGYTLYLDRMFNEAIDKFKRALEIMPDYIEANYNIALAYSAVRDYDMALKHWEKVVELAPQSNIANKSADFIQKIKDSKSP